MNRTLVVFMAILCLSAYGHSQNKADKEVDDQTNNDSIVIFTFKANSDMFFVPYGNNEAELNRLLAITKQYDAEIKGGQLPVYVRGYCYSSIRKERNLTLAKTWSNRVKSELIVRRKLKEEHFITRNYAEPYHDLNYAVVVMLKFPRDIIKDEIPEETMEEEPKKPEPIVMRDIIEDEQTGEITEVEVTIPPKEEVAVKHEKAPAIELDGAHPAFSIHTNLFYWLLATPNIGLEWRPDKNREWGILLNGAWTHWEWKNKTRKYRMWLFNTEVRRYLSDRWFVGAEFHIGELNLKLHNTGRQGGYFGAGVTGGYRLPLSKRWDMDFTLGLGYNSFHKDNYKMEDGVHIITAKNAYYSVWGPTQGGVVLRYRLK